MFRWINLTDIHVGMSDQNWLWPNLKHELFDDLKRLVAKNGPFDAVIFSGDLVQKGIASEFSAFTEIATDMIDRLEKLGKRPVLIAAPGNHDLTRPPGGGMLEVSLRQVATDRTLLNSALDPDGEYLAKIRDQFAAFTRWQDEVIASGLHATPDHLGLLPGDASYTFTSDGLTTGVIVLNSAWLQMSGGDYEGRLHVDPRQLLSVTDQDATAWCRSKWSRLLVTHHPTNWLTESALAEWNSEIFPPERFDVHLFGHMHSHDAIAVSHGGGGTRRSIQGNSIFGLEFYGNKVERSHGYSVSEICEVDGKRSIKVWPRILQEIKGGGRRLYPDIAQGLTEDNYYLWPLDSTINLDGTSLDTERLPSGPQQNEYSTSISATISTNDAEKLRFYLPQSQPHLFIRRLEQTTAREALKEESALWIGYDWGAGEDGFLWSLLCEGGMSGIPIYRIEIERYNDRADFLTDFLFSNGFTFEQLCEYLSQLPSSLLLLDGFQASSSATAGQKRAELEIEELCGIIREFAPTAKVVVRGRVKAEQVSLPFVNLQPLEEADVADYVRAHENGGTSTSSADVTTMWRYSGGSPVRLDALLRDLGVTTLGDLLANESDDGGRVSTFEVPAALEATVHDLQNSELDVMTRAYSMLEALSSLPRGEQLERIRRFHGAHGFWPKHVHELTERGLVESVLLSGMAQSTDDTASRALIVPRIVRDYVRETMDPAHRDEIDGLALELYFGSTWRSGNIRNSMAAKRCRHPLCEPYEITNASALIHRLMITAHDEEDLSTLEAGVHLTSAFIEVLRSGAHYANAAELASQVLPLLELPELQKQADVLRYSQAGSIRMLGNRDEAKQIFEKIKGDHLNKSQKRQVSLNLALIYEAEDDFVQAEKFAREVLKGGRKDGPGIQAQSILVELGDDQEKIIAELKVLEDQARKKNSHVAANNIALALSNRESGAKGNAHLERVIENTDLDRDFFNGAKAIVQAMRSRTDVGLEPTQLQLRKLIDAYQHLHNQRAGALFDKGHDALWSIFMQKNEPENLLRLFRHSSFIWRLRNQEERENKYRSPLSQLDAKGKFSKLRGLDREIAYFRARAAAVLKQLDSRDPPALEGLQ